MNDDDEETTRRLHPKCTCGYWGNPINAKQIRVLAERLARTEEELRILRLEQRSI